MEAKSVLRKILRLPAVKDATGFSRSTIYARIAEGKFPRPVKLDPEDKSSKAPSGWWEDEVIAYQKRLVGSSATA
jgi:prophage regulatory protein